MKNLINILTVIFLVSYFVVAVIFGRLPKHNTPQLLYIGFATMFLMLVCFSVIVRNSYPEPKIIKGRVYKIEKITIAYTDQGINKGFGKLYVVILSYDNNFEIYKHRTLRGADNLIGGDLCTIIDEGDNMLFTRHNP